MSGAGTGLYEPLLGVDEVRAPLAGLHVGGLKQHEAVVVESQDTIDRLVDVERTLSSLYGRPGHVWSYVHRLTTVLWHHISLIVFVSSLLVTAAGVSTFAEPTGLVSASSGLRNNVDYVTANYTFAPCPSQTAFSSNLHCVEQVCGTTSRISVLDKVLAAVALSVYWILFAFFRVLARRPGRLTVKSSCQLLQGLFLGFRRGTVMVSYSWDRDLDRRYARQIAWSFPYPICWLDIQNLLPGRSVHGTCAVAASSADVGIVFLSTEYIYSTNCMTELLHFEPRLREALAEHVGQDYLDAVPLSLHNKAADWKVPAQSGERKDPCFVVAYVHSDFRDNPIGRTILRVLRECNHCVLEDRRLSKHWTTNASGRKLQPRRCTCFRELRDNPTREVLRALTTHMVPCEERYLGVSRVPLLQALYQRQDLTPAINEDWDGTASALITWLHTRAWVGMVAVWVAVGLITRAVSHSSSFSSIKIDLQISLGAILIAVFVPVTLGIRGASRILDVHRLRLLSQTGWLLILLHRLRLIEQTPIYISGHPNDPESAGRDHPFESSKMFTVLSLLAKYRVIRIVSLSEQQRWDFATGRLDPSTCAFGLLCLDSVFASPHSASSAIDASGRCLFWTRSSFPELVGKAHAVGVGIDHAMIQLVRSRRTRLKMETVLLQLLKRALGLEEARAFVTIGSHGFRAAQVDLQLKSQSEGFVVYEAKQLTKQGFVSIKQRVDDVRHEVKQRVVDVGKSVKQRVADGMAARAELASAARPGSPDAAASPGPASAWAEDDASEPEVDTYDDTVV